MITPDERKQDDSSPAPEESTDTPERLTRKRVADALGVSIFKVRSMEGSELHPTIRDGVHYFDAEEIAALTRKMAPKRQRENDRNDGEIAALAFFAFDEGKDLFQIVTELRIPPEKVRALYREWREPDLEQYELARRKRERAQNQQRREEEEQRRHEQRMERWDRDLARLGRQPGT
jgi:hypothetical protein